MTVRLGSLQREHADFDAPVFAGFKIAALGHRNDYRSNILHDIADGFAGVLQRERPFLAGVTNDGRLIVGDAQSERLLSPLQLEDLQLKVLVAHTELGVQASLQVTSTNGATETLEAHLDRDSLMGNLALACHPLETPKRSRHDDTDIDHETFWFSDWSATGSKVSANPDQTYGPILWTQYTVQDNTLKLLAFLVPMESDAASTATLQVLRESDWANVLESEIEPLSRTALFRVEDWDSSQDAEYRVVYSWNSGAGDERATWEGLVRKNPSPDVNISLAGLSCSNSELFPNRFLEANLLAQDPDLVFFAGDQIYETNGGYGIAFAKTEADLPRSALNYLGKFWYLGLSFRELLRDRPAVMIPDDHDVYSNDLWGRNGAAMPGDSEANTLRCFGGYRMHPDWVNMVEHTQMGHHPDPFDATPVQRGIQARHTSLDLGGVSFALINDRKFKSAPGEILDAMTPLFEIRGERNYPQMDTINERDFDTTTLDRENLSLLGSRQLNFIEEWGQEPNKLRAVLSQSPYCQPHHLMVADFDSNGWPQSGRKRALETIRETNAVMIHGDLHFSTLVQQGIDDWDDAGWTFTLPAVSTATHRAWKPDTEPENHIDGMPDYTGRFLDGWGNKITVWAASNPFSFLIEDDYEGEGRATLDYLREGGLGYGIVRFDPANSAVTFESWPVYGDLKSMENPDQHPGFPKTIRIQ